MRDAELSSVGGRERGQEGPAGPRLFLDQTITARGRFELPAAAAHYVAHVMRLGAGDALLLFDDRTGEWRARLGEVGRKRVSVVVEDRLRPRETVPDLWLCAAPLKKSRLDWTAEKACELGVARFVPVLTDRTVVRHINAERLRAHMVEAAEQCGRTALPVLQEATTLDRLLSSWPEERRLLFCDEQGGAPYPAAAGRAPAAALIGPEGGFAPTERDRLLAHPQAVAVSLGPRILRADTAAVAAIALWQALAGDWTPGG